VEEAKQAALKALSGGAAGANETGASTMGLSALVKPGDYIAIQAYVAPSGAMDAAMAQARLLLRERFHVATSAAYGPRYLHSIGQLYKGGPATGMFVVITAGHAEDPPIPGAKYTFGQLQMAQALGDLQSFRKRGKPALHLHLGQGMPTGLAALRRVLQRALAAGHPTAS